MKEITSSYKRLHIDENVIQYSYNFHPFCFPENSENIPAKTQQTRDLKVTHLITFTHKEFTISLNSKTIPGIWLGSRYHAQREWERMLDASGTSPQRPVLAEPIPQRPGSGIQDPFHIVVLCLNSDMVWPWKPDETTRESQERLTNLSAVHTRNN